MRNRNKFLRKKQPVGDMGGRKKLRDAIINRKET